MASGAVEFLWIPPHGFVRGETILICKRNQPVAEIRLLPSGRSKKRPMGLAKGQLTVPKEFFDSLPQELVQAFHGDSERG